MNVSSHLSNDPLPVFAHNSSRLIASLRPVVNITQQYAKRDWRIGIMWIKLSIFVFIALLWFIYPRSVAFYLLSVVVSSFCFSLRLGSHLSYYFFTYKLLWAYGKCKFYGIAYAEVLVKIFGTFFGVIIFYCLLTSEQIKQSVTTSFY